jgi:hypothetical protein
MFSWGFRKEWVDFSELVNSPMALDHWLDADHYESPGLPELKPVSLACPSILSCAPDDTDSDSIISFQTDSDWSWQSLDRECSVQIDDDYCMV